MKKIKFDGWEQMIESWRDEFRDMNEFSRELRREMIKEQLAYAGLILMVVALLTIIIVNNL